MSYKYALRVGRAKKLPFYLFLRGETCDTVAMLYCFMTDYLFDKKTMNNYVTSHVKSFHQCFFVKVGLWSILANKLNVCFFSVGD